MWIDQYITDEQDPKTAEKVLNKLRDMLTTGEAIVYLAIQKKPAVTLMPDCIAVTSKRLVFCLPGNLGLTTNFITFTWADVKEVSFREEFFGAKFLAIPQKGENIAIDYIPKVQARKLYQFCNEQLEKQKEQDLQHTEDRQMVSQQPESPVNENVIAEPLPVAEDELTQKLKKLKLLFEKQLITQEEYEQKKADILSQL
ncbi:MAG TPA: PH domain-containing protein [Sphingobacteriaceae bacterium]|nr:PH domain-containing protein [Sphingobacteriaceae bacterium]